MPAKIFEKEHYFNKLEKDISVISVINDYKKRPYLESFSYAPENISREPLGSLVGFFKINDLSEDSAYIVNFLASVVKKEYYANARRSSSDSLDAALKKVNVALAEIVNQGNINWLGTMDGAVCILEKNNIHFSVTGDAKILLLRNQTLTDISEDLAPSDIDPNPLKTFENVSSGRLENNDKIILTSHDIFDVFSAEEIKKSALHFKGEKFVQFLKTALVNELALASTIIIDINEKIESEVALETAKRKAAPRVVPNAFSEKTFKELPKKSGSFALPRVEEEEKEYTDEKTGHIYLREEFGEGQTESNWKLYWFVAREKIADIFFNLKNRAKRKIIFSFRQIKKTISRPKPPVPADSPWEETATLKEEIASTVEIKTEEPYQVEKMEDISSDISSREGFLTIEDAKEEIIKPPKIKISDLYKAYSNQYWQKISSAVKSFKEKLSQALKKKTKETMPEEEIIETAQYFETGVEKKERFSSAFSWYTQKVIQLKSQKPKESLPPKTIPAVETPLKKKGFRLLPKMDIIKYSFQKFSYAQKIYILLAILLIIAVPLIIRSMISSKDVPAVVENSVPAPVDPRAILSQEKNMNFVENASILGTFENPKMVLYLNNTAIVIANNKVSSIKDNGTQDFSWPQSLGNIKLATMLPDLNLVLLYTDQNKVISWSPVSHQFSENKADIPASANIRGIGTFMTYLYLLDVQNNQIYRYPRAVGGFGTLSNWLKDSMSFANIQSFAVDDNIYIAQNNVVVKLFKGQKINFNLEPTAVPFNIDKISTNSNLNNLYVLDKANGRIIKYTKDGYIAAQYYSAKIKTALDFAADETNNKIYFIDSDGELVSFGM